MQLHLSTVIMSSVPSFAASSLLDMLSGSASFLVFRTSFQLTQSSTTTQGRNIPIIVVPSFVATFNTPASAPTSSSAHATSSFSLSDEVCQAPHTKLSALADWPFVVGTRLLHHPFRVLPLLPPLQQMWQITLH